jgi:ABC-type transport system involved in multi-copper enzyme maturation permease subunit
MKKILAVSELTFRKIKEPAYSMLLLLAIGVGYFVSEMEPISFQNDDLLAGLVAPDQGAAVLSGFVFMIILTLLIAVFSGATDLPRDIESRMIMIILSKPVNRLEYLFGKFIGIAGICLLFYTLSFISAVITHIASTGACYSLSIIARQLLLTLIIFPFVAMTVTVSTFLSDISAMIVTVVYLLFSLSLSTLAILIALLPKEMSISSLVFVFYYFFPNYFYFMHSFKLFGLVSLSLIIYATSITTIFLMIAARRMNTRDML